MTRPDTGRNRVLLGWALLSGIGLLAWLLLLLSGFGLGCSLVGFPFPVVPSCQCLLELLSVVVVVFESRLLAQGCRLSLSSLCGVQLLFQFTDATLVLAVGLAQFTHPFRRLGLFLGGRRFLTNGYHNVIGLSVSFLGSFAFVVIGLGFVGATVFAFTVHNRGFVFQGYHFIVCRCLTVCLFAHFNDPIQNSPIKAAGWKPHDKGSYSGMPFCDTVSAPCGWTWPKPPNFSMTSMAWRCSDESTSAKVFMVLALVSSACATVRMVLARA